MAALPVGLVTLLFADVEASTKGFTEHGDLFGAAIKHLHAAARRHASHCGGCYAKHLGDGFLLAFTSPLNAVLCAKDIQTDILGEQWNASLPRIKVRIGIHTDHCTLLDGEYTWPAAWRAHRVMDAAHGGQILLSEAAAALVRGALDPAGGLRCVPLGSFHLRDLAGSEELYRIDIEGLPGCTHPPRTLPASRHNLPEEERAFIGRVEEIRGVRSLFCERGRRLVTITGIGGIGKTRLAKQAAAALVDDYEDGVWLVECDPLRNGEEIVAAIGGVLGVTVDSELPIAALQKALAQRNLLLLLDCFERLTDHSAVIEDILRRAARVACLVTSRKRLGLSREIEFPLKTMPTAPGSRARMADSISLFVDAATYADPGFALSPANRKLVSRLCDALEGIPLAIILAASRLRYHTIEELVQRVQENRFAVLHEPTARPDPHSDLRRVVAAQFRLLPDEDQTLLLRLSLFVGGFYDVYCTAVCGPESATAAHDGIARLRDHSLVEPQRLGERTRYRILDTVREYLADAIDQAAEADLETCRRRHAELFCDIARRIGDRMRQGLWKEATDDLWREIGNLRAAIDYSIRSRSRERVAAFADSLGRTYVEAGLWTDFDALARAAEVALAHLDKPEWEARLLGFQAQLARRRSEEDTARTLMERRLALCERLGDVAACADTLFDLAGQASELGDHAGAQRLLRRAIRLVRKEKLPGLLASARGMQAEVSLAQNDPAAAHRHARQAQAVLDAQTDKDTAIYIYLMLARACRRLDDYPAAERALRDMLGTALEGERTFGVSRALLEIGALYEAERKLSLAARAYLAADKIHADLKTGRKKETASELARFRKEVAPLEIRQWLSAAGGTTWQELVLELWNNAGDSEQPALAWAIADR